LNSKTGEWAENLKRMQAKLEIIKQLPSTEPGVYLHLGCGPQILEGFINIDKYQQGEGILQVDMEKPPFVTNTATAIYSSHALEHLPFRRAISALQNWAKVLKLLGKLYLAIPDLEEILKIMIDPKVSWDLKWGWYVYTLFGYQIDPSKYGGSYLGLDAPEDPGQFHTCGFTKDTIPRFLTGFGFEIDEIYNYDGWGTPSMFIEAHKAKEI